MVRNYCLFFWVIYQIARINLVITEMKLPIRPNLNIITGECTKCPVWIRLCGTLASSKLSTWLSSTRRRRSAKGCTQSVTSLHGAETSRSQSRERLCSNNRSVNIKSRQHSSKVTGFVLNCYGLCCFFISLSRSNSYLLKWLCFRMSFFYILLLFLKLYTYLKCGLTINR